MPLWDEHSGLYTDHYELAMAQAYYLNGMHEVPACFDYFFRQNPFSGGYAVFAGLSDLLAVLERLRFGEDDCAYLASIGFSRKFTDFLGTFRFNADIRAAAEGDVVFPIEPVFRVDGNILECQIIETLVLNLLNFETLIATKAARIRGVAGDRLVADFGLRRAQGPGGILASRAATIGGVNATSNVYSAFLFGLTSTGTQAHSWIQAYNDELSAFRDFARLYPERCILLVDTYDTLRSGVPNAITVAREMESRGGRLFGIRLDSGDLAYLSKRARAMLDEAGLQYVRIVASNLLDEHIIKSLLEQGAPLDAFGVGTKLVTGHPDGALDGVYKLSESGGKPRIKLSETADKISLPGHKKVIRFIDERGFFCADGIVQDDENDPDVLYHPFQTGISSRPAGCRMEQLLGTVMEKGRIAIPHRSVGEIAAFARARLLQLPEEHKRFENPHVYKVGISRRLKDLRNGLVDSSRTSRTSVGKDGTGR
jgi:nicotinate phosphoribosyltransferase